MKRVMVIGLDGFTPDLASRWIAEGRLPHIARLAAGGALLPLRGVTPPVTYPAWTTCVTGVNPGRHGLVDFTQMLPGQYALRFLNSADRKAPALWNILSNAGRRVCVLGVPGTYPPEPVNGLLLSGFDSPVASAIDRSFVYPREAWPRVRDWRFAAFQEHRITPAWHGRALEALEEKIGIKTAIARDLLSVEPWDFFMMVFGEADTVSHHCWPLEDGESPRRAAMLPDAPAHPIRRVYERLDAAVGALVKQADEETLVLVISDHGFGGADIQTLHLNNFLAKYGWLRRRRITHNLFKRFALRWLPVRGRGALFRRFQAAAERLESRARFGGIDWDHTRAWSDELDYFPSVRVNLAGREPKGQVAMPQYADTVAELCALLETLPPVARALPRDAVYDGPWSSRAPDIILELDWSTGYRVSCSRSPGGPTIETLPPERWAGGKEQGCSGVHRNPAFLACNKALSRSQPCMMDIAPTVLAYLNVLAPDMEGMPLLGNNVGPVHSAQWTPPSENRYTEEQEALLEARMRALGYFE